MTNMKKEKDEIIERLVGGYQPVLSQKEGYYMSNAKKESIIEGYQPKNTGQEKFERGYKPQSSSEKPKPPQGGSGNQNPKK